MPVPRGVESILAQQLARFLERLRLGIGGGEGETAQSPMSDVGVTDRFDHAVVVLVGQRPDLARLRPAERPHRIGIGVSHPGQQEPRVPPARPRGEMRPLHQRRRHPAPA